MGHSFLDAAASRSARTIRTGAHAHEVRTLLPSAFMSASLYALQNVYGLSGLVALVTGCGTGIGLMITHGLATAGAKVYITGRRKDVLDKVVAAWDKQDGEIIA